MRYDPRQHCARTTEEFVFHQLVPYLGNKRNLLDVIGAAIDATGIDPRTATFLDAFAGSGAVSRYAKHRGFAVLANDWEPYAHALNLAAIECNAPPQFASLGGHHRAIAQLNALPGSEGWVTGNLCPRDDNAPDPASERLFYRRTTGMRIDAIRSRIAEWHAEGQIDDAEVSCLLAPLLYQACWLANTSGVFKGFHAGWGGKNGTALHRILADLHLSPTRFLDNGRVHRVLAQDALSLATHVPEQVDIAYLDPPYNQHPYASNYHVLNSLVLWDQPILPPATARGMKSAIRADWQQRRSPFNHRERAIEAYRHLLEELAKRNTRCVLTSYSTDGTIPLAQLVAATSEHGALQVFCRRHRRYRTSPTRPSARATNVEFVLLCDTRAPRQASDGERVLATIEATQPMALAERE
jgi:adenine-specific DNA-methyltransferase